jgi:hypothetical protein
VSVHSSGPREVRLFKYLEIYLIIHIVYSLVRKLKPVGLFDTVLDNIKRRPLAAYLTVCWTIKRVGLYLCI